MLIGTPLVLFILQIIVFSRDIPFMDDFDAILNYLSFPFPERCCKLFDFHNEHRIFTSRVIFEAIFALLGRFDFRVCIIVGDCILLGYMFLWGQKVSQRIGIDYFIPFLWLFLDLSNYENTLWAMTAVSNQLVLLLAFVTFILFDRHNHPLYFYVSLLTAALCTYTTGAGMFIWPSLVILALKDWAIKHDAWRSMCFSTKDILGLFSGRSLAFIGVALATSLFYLHGFFDQSRKIQAAFNIPPIGNSPVLTGLDYLFSFCGAIAPIHAVALPLGIIIVLCICYILFNIRCVQDNAILGMLLFALGSAVSGVIFRSRFGAGQALQLRYEIVSLTLITATFILITGLPPPNLRDYWKLLVKFILMGCILINISTLTVGWELMQQRTRQLEIGIGLGPSSEAIPNRPEITLPRERAETIGRAIKLGIWTPR